MAATVVQAGPNLYLVSDDGTAATQLTLPSGVTLRTDVKPRWQQIDNYLVMVNTPSQPLIIDSTGTVRLLCPKPPRLAPTLAAVAGGTLTGTYSGVRYTFLTVDSVGNIISESDFSPASGSQQVSSQFLQVTGLDISPDQISRRRIYRPTNNGAVLFQWVDLDGNVQTSIQDDLSDAGLSLVAAPILGTPPKLNLIAEFRGRLMGVGDVDVDNIRYTEAGVRYAWPEDNILPISGVGSDKFGISALLPRKEALGVGRRDMLLAITGTGAEDGTGNIDFNVVIISRECGVESQESVKIFRDTAYFLWKDGVYSWGPDGLKCVSDGENGKGQVRTWFVTDQVFNREQFKNAFAVIDPTHPHYRLFLCSAGSNVIDRFIDYDINEGTWWGPHKTAAFTPTSAFQRITDADTSLPLVCSTGYIYQDQETRTDGASTAIAMETTGKPHDMDDPDEEKYWGEMSIFGEGNQANGVVDVSVRYGTLNNTLDAVQNNTTKNLYYQQKLTRQRLGRIGRGKHAQVSLLNSQVGQDVVLYGYEIDPVTLIGRR